MKLAISKRVCGIVCVVALILSFVNLYLILNNIWTLQDKISTLQRDYSADDSIYSYVIFMDGDLCKAKNQTSGSVDFISETAAPVINQAIAKGRLVYIKLGNYELTSDVEVENGVNARIVSDGAIINGNGNRIVIRGDNYTVSQFNLISGLRIVNATVRIENSFGTTLSNLVFEDCSTALELVNTETWSEGTKIDNVHFVNSGEAIAFRTPVGNATGSYASTEISRCFFNLVDDSVGINVERNAEYSDSQLLNSRLWMGEHGKSNQTGLLVDGSMFQTLISGVVFESFADKPTQLYAIAIGENAVTPPTLVGGVSFLGNWSARINNPSDKWISGSGSIFQKENMPIPVGLNNQYAVAESIHARPLTISSFKPRIQVKGTFGDGETIVVRFRLELLDNTVSGSIEKTFTSSSAIWLNDFDMLNLFPSQNLIWAILVDAKTNAESTNVTVEVDVFGTAT